MFNILISAVLAATGAGAQAVQATPVSGQTPAPIAKVLLDAVHDADSPPDEKTLRVLCAARVETGPVVSFVGAADGRVLLATFTGEPLVDPGREVGLLHLPRPIDLAKTPGGVLISRGNVAPKPKPANPQVSRSQTWDWGYVYDHNGDGRIDHLVFLIGAMFIEPENAPINLPSLLGPNNIVDRQTASFVLDNLQAGFWQLLDVDHDGAIDTLAYPAMQNANGWFRGWAVLTDPGAAPARRTCRIMDRDGRVIEGCTAVAGGAGGIDDGHGGYDGSTASAHEHAQRPDLVWEALQQGANACRLKAGNFRP